MSVTTAASAAVASSNIVFKSFSVRSLELNLSRGRAASEKLVAPITSLTVSFGSDSCPAKPALSLFYVNELPRIYKANPHLKFHTIESPDASCSLNFTYTTSFLEKANNTSDHVSPKSSETIELRHCTTPEDIFTNLVRQFKAISVRTAEKQR
ncbi:hypothetical protein BATDEDRAFT_88935 [Batrachochytrium dendrobatidis JAM81]|uniref:Ribosomal protein/NADH dehydrogenase domain-containing protein n=2 Tax=Batrachochytrium dendrobatidis TaxID=109871 RepID=F4P3B4_BATDJ|nr:uncharacterized protein BATDEDRAFT_88935 [Batrachochytrium dendrobatidis JAM81]EGF80186.1 hypothetical protein BATDEDRAFT_88935 [Batrachochytrium dendrobatidis JAM81]KAJ8326460.1 hypothetical protein O5D80_005208 [Batrachochytrium dendrobatidis]KAK5666752.1 hypothetical protein QVD99_006809 [Batrachochytrium dendrobatidis]OAJ41110.1 hypothetical protein BDEG_24755 [Batrachochytrium dendrobatidis JEL423]|eukprot:XP_006679203.1 hypothetical protein BATDEDRAFT_88935 [Batrachochytrium dendrobatidis JAM81]